MKTILTGWSEETHIAVGIYAFIARAFNPVNGHAVIMRNKWKKAVSKFRHFETIIVGSTTTNIDDWALYPIWLFIVSESLRCVD